MTERTGESEGAPAKAPEGQHAYSHGEGTTDPGPRQRAGRAIDRSKAADAGSRLREDVDGDDIYGGRSDIAGAEEATPGASEDAAG